jgi:hypothetical protein
VFQVAAATDPVVVVVTAVFSGVSHVFKNTLKAITVADPVTVTAVIGGVDVVIDRARLAMVTFRRAREVETEWQRQMVLADER